MFTEPQITRIDTYPGALFHAIRWFPFAFGHFVAALVLGTVVVVSPLPIREAAAIVWLVILFVFIRDYFRDGRRKLALAALLLQAFVMAGVVTAATLAPGKTADRILDGPVTLPQREMTLAELDQYTEEHRYRHYVFPITVWLTFVEADASNTVRFPEEQITLREFVSAIEGQTALRHSFRGCGNGYTVLWGNDCSFGLSLRDPKTIWW